MLTERNQWFVSGQPASQVVGWLGRLVHPRLSAVRPVKWDKLVFGFPRTLMRGFARPSVGGSVGPSRTIIIIIIISIIMRCRQKLDKSEQYGIGAFESDFVGHFFFIAGRRGPVDVCEPIAFLSPEWSSTADKIRSSLMDLSNIGGGRGGTRWHCMGVCPPPLSLSSPRTRFSPAVCFSRRNRRVITNRWTDGRPAAAVH